ncbi:MAG TPA: ABC transporter permease [Nitrolancea sp.]|jgi:peptide/nickel transport system permease protein|nr:ABC transporter permease [Nitrolancea sp.]
MTRTQYVIRRIVQSIVTVFIAATITFAILRLIPGDPTMMFEGPFMPPDVRQHLLADFGLDKPVPVQYAKYLLQLAQGNFGVSFSERAPVTHVILSALPWTLLLTGTSVLLTLLLAIPLGILTVMHRGKVFDLLIRGVTVATGALFIPWVSLIALNFFGLHLKWFPIGGAETPVLNPGDSRVLDVIRHLILPVLVLTLTSLGPYVLFLRTSLVEVMETDYVRTARAKGVVERRVLLSHAFRNALIPLVTVVGLRLGFLVGGAVLAETVFAYPGVGRLIFRSVQQHDYPVLQGAFLMLAITVVLFNLLTDLLYGFLDPRIRYGR